MLIMSMIPAAALAADDDGYGLWVDGTEVTVDNADNVLGDDTVSYNAETKTLTLNGAEIDTAHTDGSYTSGIYAEGDINIVLRGSSSINISGGQITAGVHANGVILSLIHIYPYAIFSQAWLFCLLRYCGSA